MQGLALVTTLLLALLQTLALADEELDTNVDPSSTYQVVDALIEADKNFDYIMVPGANHGVGDSSKHLRRKRIEFFQEHLQLPES
ncbi:MAG: prolyl oligopeptidase family serine peptidase [Akkermansiaceae bacterium]|nr:prolyl oligopeptidase family serine peptidase [Akkermansiaceae bacterium]